MNTASGIITMKISEWSKITKIIISYIVAAAQCSHDVRYSYFSNFRPLSYFQSDYNRSCINTIVLLKMSA